MRLALLSGVIPRTRPLYGRAAAAERSGSSLAPLPSGHSFSSPASCMSLLISLFGAARTSRMLTTSPWGDVGEASGTPCIGTPPTATGAGLRPIDILPPLAGLAGPTGRPPPRCCESRSISRMLKMSSSLETGATAALSPPPTCSLLRELSRPRSCPASAAGRVALLGVLIFMWDRSGAKDGCWGGGRPVPSASRKERISFLESSPSLPRRKASWMSMCSCKASLIPILLSEARCMSPKPVAAAMPCVYPSGSELSLGDCTGCSGMTNLPPA